MTTYVRFILTSLVLSATITARAESARAPLTGRTLSPILAVLDSDRNGSLSAREIAAAPVTLAALDLNEDGMISPAEQLAINADGRTARNKRGATSFNIVFTLDANHDGDIQTLEIANAVSSLKRLDRNGDGELTPDELRPVMVAQNRS